MSNQWAIITGASAGIGAAMFRRFIQHEPNINCLAVARRLPQLEEVKRQAIDGLDDDKRSQHIILSADVSTEEGISRIVSTLPENSSVKYLIHNAGLLGPIAPLVEIDRSTWYKVVSTNLDAHNRLEEIVGSSPITTGKFNYKTYAVIVKCLYSIYKQNSIHI